MVACVRSSRWAMRPLLRSALLVGSVTTTGVLAAGEVSAQSAAPQVRIASGRLAGTPDRGTVSFKNIPYAAPPVGARRWTPPQPVVPWKGIRAADRAGAICQQKYQPTDNGVGPLPMSEDCLTLNVYAPAGAKRAPVMFWIHGGGFVNGSGTAALYDGTALARQGVVVVTINYRLGRFGFFAHPALTAEAKGQAVGNYGLMDMIAALRWVRANIGRFGGNPGQVTIFGESAGGVAVNDLMVSPAARGLFAGAIVQSGLGREPAPVLADAEKAGEGFAKSLGLQAVSAIDLRSLTAEQILKGGDPDMVSGGGGSMIDGTILTMSPLAAFRAGRQADVPYVTGWNSLEFPAPAAILEARVGTGSPVTTQNRDRIKSAYPSADSYEQNLLSDVLFVEPAVNLARLHAARGRPTWVYQFSVLAKAAPATLKGTPHAMERQYVFGTLNASPFPTDANDAAQAATVSAYWVAFAEKGDPNGGGRPAWPAFDAGTGRILEFTNQGPTQSGLPRESALHALSAAYP
jgi:para-nitrobenzyl esterase